MEPESLGASGGIARDAIGEMDRKLDQLIGILDAFDRRLGTIEERLAEVIQGTGDRQSQKEWYTTRELADLLGKSDFTVREKWCNQGRIACEKAPDSGKWRISGDEARRLQNGGSLLPRRPR